MLTSLPCPYRYAKKIVFSMVRKIRNRPNKRGNSNSSKQYQQQRLDLYPSELQNKQPRKSKQIIISRLDLVTKYDEIVLTVEFALVPSKTAFSKVRSTLWFDNQEVKSDLITIPQSLGGADEFQLNYTLDIRGISAGVHSIKAELCDLFYPCSAIKEEHVDYVPLDRKAAYRKIPIAKKVAGGDFTIVSSSDKEIYTDIEQARKSELDSKRDKW
jgi:hypothetical protein